MKRMVISAGPTSPHITSPERWSSRECDTSTEWQKTVCFDHLFWQTFLETSPERCQIRERSISMEWLTNCAHVILLHQISKLVKVKFSVWLSNREVGNHFSNTDQDSCVQCSLGIQSQIHCHISTFTHTQQPPTNNPQLIVTFPLTTPSPPSFAAHALSSPQTLTSTSASSERSPEATLSTVSGASG